MLRDKALIPLSQQHHFALALCVRMRKALQRGHAALDFWQAEMQREWEGDVRVHFETEEELLFSDAIKYAEIKPLVDELLAEHRVLRDYFARAAQRTLGARDLEQFAELLSNHIRKEERELFEACQRAMPPEELDRLKPLILHAVEDTASQKALCDLQQRRQET